MLPQHLIKNTTKEQREKIISKQPLGQELPARFGV